MFTAELACKRYSRSSNNKLSNTFVSPVYNLVDFTTPSVAVVHWAALIGIYAALRYWLPIGLWNSVDGLYINETRCIVVSLVVYYVLFMVLVAGLNDTGCKAREDAAYEYLTAEPKQFEQGLEADLERFRPR